MREAGTGCGLGEEGLVIALMASLMDISNGRDPSTGRQAAAPVGLVAIAIAGGPMLCTAWGCSRFAANCLHHGTGKTSLGVDLSKEGGSYRVVVWDDGQGVSPEALAVIVERRNGPDGTGHAGGPITAINVPNQRTAFTVSLPASGVTAPQPTVGSGHD